VRPRARYALALAAEVGEFCASSLKDVANIGGPARCVRSVGDLSDSSKGIFDGTKSINDQEITAKKDLGCEMADTEELNVMKRDPGLKVIVQVAVVCRDIEVTAKRWAVFLGMEVPTISSTGPGSECGMVYRGKPSNARCKLAFFETGVCRLELIQPLGPGSSWWDVLEKNGESIHHLAFEVKDLEGTLRACEEQGMPMFHQGHWDGGNGTYAYIDSQKQLGAMIEILNFRKEST
jgi:methylmalonyl-CoA/ethylmalonyl-CoA epimerase